MTTKRALSREESKLITRRRLIEAAAKILGGEGYAGLSASAVARAAEVAQPTFYVHFRDMNDLLGHLAAEKFGALGTALREARLRLRGASDVEGVRQTFRLPLETMLREPALFRLYVQELSQPASPLHARAQEIYHQLRRDLAEDLVRIGVAAATAAEREQVEMIAEAMIAQTQALGIGYLEGRYSSLEGMVDILTRFAVGVVSPT